MRAAFFSLILLTGCFTQQSVDLTGRECPCAEGWSCNEDNECVHGRGGGPGRDGGTVDRDTSTPPGDTGTPPADTGTPMGGEIRIEAEDMTVNAPFEVMSDANASNGMYVVSPNLMGALIDLPTAEMADDGRLSATFMVTEAGMYKVWGRILVPTGDDDSNWVRIDDGAWVNWNRTGEERPMAATEWTFDDVHDSPAAAEYNPLEQMLDVGMHTIDIESREDGAQIDLLVITNDLGTTPPTL